VTTADEAQSISVIDTFPQLAEAEVAPSDSANAAVAVNILSFICVSLLSFFLHRPVSRPCDPRSGFGSRVLGLCILSSMNLTKAVEIAERDIQAQICGIVRVFVTNPVVDRRIASALPRFSLVKTIGARNKRSRHNRAAKPQ
jgi:hypothetical protein